MPEMTWEEQAELRNKLNQQAKDELEKFQAALKLAGFKVTRVHTLVNGYHGWNNDYVVTPWYLFETDVGLLTIGWRKRVINVDWESTDVKWVRPVDKDVTACDKFFHAWGYDKLYEYLRLLRPELEAGRKKP